MTKRLSDFQVDAPPLPTFREGWVLAIDQTITNTGWALVQFYKDDERIERIEVIETGLIKTEPTGKKGYYDTYARVELIWEQYIKLLLDHAQEGIEIAHEMPAVFGQRTDSSMLAAAVLRCACANMGFIPTMYGAQAVKKAVTGRANASKAEVKSGVKSLAPSVVNCKPNNEHTNDAIAIAIKHMRTN